MTNFREAFSINPDTSASSAKHKAGGAPKLKGRAIVTYGRSLISLVIARSLHEQGIEVIGCDDVGMTVLSFSKHVSDTFLHANYDTDEEQALVDIEKAVRKYAPKDDRPYVLIPAFRDARLFAKYRDRFEPLIKIAAPDISSINLIDPKDAFSRFVAEHDLAAPETEIIIPCEREKHDFSHVSFPRIAKPVDGVGGRGVKKIRSVAELNTYLDDAPDRDPVLLQELVDGEDYCVSVIANHGELAGMVVYRNLRQFPVEAGAGAIRETVDGSPFEETTRKLLKCANWNGVAEIDFRWDGRPESVPKMLEVNPRYWAGLFHSTESGIDFPLMAYKLGCGESILNDRSAGDVEIGFQSKTPAAWILSIAEEVAGSDEHLKQSGEAWAEMKSLASKGDILKAAHKLLESAGHSASAPAMLGKLQKEISKHSDLPSEFSVDDDPAVGLGILFALSSLQRHGTLPPELKFDSPEKGEKSDTSDSKNKKKHKTGRPVIGITKPDEGDTLSYLAMKFAVWLAGGKPVKITSQAPRDPHSIDGLVFGGGSDVYPERYQGKVRQGHRYDLPRDEMEASWADAALNNGIPVLGVCRGMQMLNVLQGGTLFPDLSNYSDIKYPTSLFKRIFYRKPISIEDGSWLAEAVGKSLVSVNSIHTQAIRELGDGFKVAACELNGLVQSIEHETAVFMVGVQFHPELMIHRSFARNIFKRFVDCAKTCR